MLQSTFKGERYQCIKCTNASTVRYQKGFISVTDTPVHRQAELRKKYPASCLGNEKPYYIIEAICINCVNEIRNSMIVDESHQFIIKQAMLKKLMDDGKEIIIAYLDNCINNYDPELLKKYITRTIAEIPSNNDNQGVLLSLRIRKMKERILSNIFISFECSDAFVKWTQSLKLMSFDLYVLAGKLQDYQLFYEFDRLKERDLFPIVVSEMTMVMKPYYKWKKPGFYYLYNDELIRIQEQIIPSTEKNIQKMRYEITKSTRKGIQDFKKFLEDRGIDESILLKQK